MRSDRGRRDKPGGDGRMGIKREPDYELNGAAELNFTGEGFKGARWSALCATVPEAMMNRVSVLVVEDELLIALDIEMILEDAGYSVLGPVKSASAALEKIASTGADLALLDVNLETGNTFPVADALSERGIPFIFMTGHTQTAFPREHRARPILNKPCRPGHLIEALAELQAELKAGDAVSHKPRIATR